jgi:hypothetical protein
MPFIVHIVKVKPFFAEPPKSWLETTTETEVSEIIEKIVEESEVSDTDEVLNDDALPIDSGPLNEPLVSESVDVLTFDENQEFRRNRPRREIRRPSRFAD